MSSHRKYFPSALRLQWDPATPAPSSGENGVFYGSLFASKSLLIHHECARADGARLDREFRMPVKCFRLVKELEPKLSWIVFSIYLFCEITTVCPGQPIVRGYLYNTVVNAGFKFAKFVAWVYNLIKLCSALLF